MGLFWFNGWVMWVRNSKVNPMSHLDLHTVGYLIIALIYLIFAIKK